MLGDKGVKLENLVANSLKRELDWPEDTEGLKTGLHFVLNKDGLEIDFLVNLEDRPSYLIEVKWADQEPAKSLRHFSQFWTGIKTIQLVGETKREKT